MQDTALLIVDVQNDFCPGGALPVPEGDQVVPVLNRVAQQVAQAGGLVFASRDWHPPTTRHFAAYGGKWPVHCVQNTPGAEFHPDLKLPEGTTIISKGTGERDDGYSAFEGHTAEGKTLLEILRERGVRRLIVGGLATDYCVRASALDALKHGFEVIVLTDAVRGVDVQPGDSERALQEMRTAGATLTTSEALPNLLAQGG
ncbi:MAG: bifunctional nicotinamidase/pyrazinamidase [Armatimonadota bacterium]